MSDPSTPAPINLTMASSAADAQAVAAVEQHHAELAGELAARVEALLAATDRPGGIDESGALAARDRLVEFLTTQLVPHAIAEEEVLYPAAAADARAKLLVESMIAQHRMLRLLIEKLAATTRPVSAVALALAIRVLFDVHLAKENELILPLVAADPTVSLAEILGGMHELLGAAAEGCGHGHGHGHDHGHSHGHDHDDHAHSAGGCGCGGDSGGCGCGGDSGGCGCGGDSGGCGCGGHEHTDTPMPTATQPDAAARAVGHDHGNCGCGEQGDAGSPVLDVRQIPHAIRHATVFGAVAAVPSGESLVLVAPHDPLPLLAQLDAREPNTWTVAYQQRGPEAWRLLLTRG